MLSMPELVWKFNTFKLRWFPLFGVFTPLNVWTDEGQPCDYSATCSVLPAFRMVSCVWGFRYLDSSYILIIGALSKSPSFAGTSPVEMGFARGKR